MLANPVTRFCKTCGNELESSGECNICLLKLGISQAGGEALPAGNLTLPSVEELNAQFPQLEVTRLVGRGGMGAIYHARQTALDRDVAVKLIAKEVSSNEAFVERFEREAKTLAKLSHPHIVTIFDFGRTPDGIAYLIMEYVDGINLREAMAGGEIASDEALEVVATICRTLEYAHSKGVVHRDIKPENILLGEDGTLKVADFGIAKIVDQSMPAPTLTATRQVLGSLHYLAPEHLEAPDQVDHRVDLYALGVVFYELLTGQLPLGRYEAPSALHRHLDHRLDSIVFKTLSRKPDQRYQNASELSADLDTVSTNLRARDSGLPESVDEFATSSRPPRHPAVPFSCEAMLGFAEAVGVLHARDDMLCAEFRVRDVFGATKSQSHLVEIPRKNLTRLEFAPGVFGAKIVVTVDKPSVLGEFPNAETGRAELSIKRKDQDYAREVVRELGFEEASPANNDLRSAFARPASPDSPIEANRLIFALLMLVCGLLNGGGLAIVQAVFAKELRDIPLVSAAVGSAVVLGPLTLIQLLAGTLNLFTNPRSLNFFAAVISMLPLSPVWVLSFPTGFWASRWMKRDGAMPVAAAASAKKNWGATTLMFIRESRWAKVVGLLNALGLVVILAGAVGWRLGYYPTEMRYRVVGKNTDYLALDKATKSRLKECSGLRGIAYDYDTSNNPTHFTIKTWKRSRDQVEGLLSVQDVPQLVWLQSVETSAPSQAVASELAQQPIPVASGIDVSSLRTEQRGLGTAVYAAAPPFELPSELVTGVSDGNSRSGQLVIELTARGREELASKLSDVTSSDGLALVIGGLVEGIASQISHKQLVFQLSKTSALTSEGIIAGLRGPRIPAALELLD